MNLNHVKAFCNYTDAVPTSAESNNKQKGGIKSRLMQVKDRNDGGLASFTSSLPLHAKSHPTVHRELPDLLLQNKSMKLAGER